MIYSTKYFEYATWRGRNLFDHESQVEVDNTKRIAPTYTTAVYAPALRQGQCATFGLLRWSNTYKMRCVTSIFFTSVKVGGYATRQFVYWMVCHRNY